MLLGRCCCAWVVLVQRWQDSLESGGPSANTAAKSSYSPAWQTGMQLLQSSLAGVVQWLAAADTVQQLAAVGYQPQHLRQQLAEVVECLESSDTKLAGMFGVDAFLAEAAVLKDIQQQLQAAGKVLACLAIPHACNNPACRNLCGPSEAQVVGGRSCICAGCRTARYCGRACQRAVWRQHKPICNALAAAAAATAASTEAAAAEGSSITTD